MSPLNLSLFCPLLCFLLTGGSLGTGHVCRVCPCTRATVGLTPTHMNADVKIWCSNEVLSTWCRHVQNSCFWLQPVCISLIVFPSFSLEAVVYVRLQQKSFSDRRSKRLSVFCLLLANRDSLSRCFFVLRRHSSFCLFLQCLQAVWFPSSVVKQHRLPWRCPGFNFIGFTTETPGGTAPFFPRSFPNNMRVLSGSRTLRRARSSNIRTFGKVTDWKSASECTRVLFSCGCVSFEMIGPYVFIPS